MYSDILHQNGTKPFFISSTCINTKMTMKKYNTTINPSNASFISSITYWKGSPVTDLSQEQNLLPGRFFWHRSSILLLETAISSSSRNCAQHIRKDLTTRSPLSPSSDCPCSLQHHEDRWWRTSIRCSWVLMVLMALATMFRK